MVIPLSRKQRQARLSESPPHQEGEEHNHLNNARKRINRIQTAKRGSEDAVLPCASFCLQNSIRVGTECRHLWQAVTSVKLRKTKIENNHNTRTMHSNYMSHDKIVEPNTKEDFQIGALSRLQHITRKNLYTLIEWSCKAQGHVNLYTAYTPSFPSGQGTIQTRQNEFAHGHHGPQLSKVAPLQRLGHLGQTRSG